MNSTTAINSSQSWLNGTDHDLGNDTELEEWEILNDIEVTATTIIYFVIILVGIPSNIVVLISLRRVFRESPSTFALIAQHLCLASFYIVGITLPINTAWLVAGQWHAGAFTCKLLMMIRPVGFYMTALLIVFLSINRYIVVSSQLAVHQRYRRGAYMYVMWLISLLFSVPQIFAFRVFRHDDDGTVQCITADDQDPYFGTHFDLKAYAVVHFTISYALPVVTICGAQCALMRTFKRHKASVSRVSGCSHHGGQSVRRHCTNGSEICRQASNVGNTSLSNGSTVLGNEFGQKHRLRSVSRARDLTLKTSAAMLIFYVACWSPYYILHFLRHFVGYVLTELKSPYIHVFVNSCAMVNCCVNPILYGFMVPSVRRASVATMRNYKFRILVLVAAIICLESCSFLIFRS